MSKNTLLTTPIALISGLIAGLLLILSFNTLATTQNSDLEVTISSTEENVTLDAEVADISAIALKTVGKADMDLLWFSVYSAKLLSVDGQYKTAQFPLKLEIQYHRDIEAEDLIEATLEQWEHIGIDGNLIPRLQAHIEDVWPDVKEGDQLSFMMHEQSKGQFFFNGQPLPMINEPGFSEAFLGIWLSENTSRPELRQQLIGAKND